MAEGIKISFVKDRFIAILPQELSMQVKIAGFLWDFEVKNYATKDYRVAEKLIRYCDQPALFQIKSLKDGIYKSVVQSANAESNFRILHNPAVTPRPYQLAGVEYILPRPAVLLADEQGIGKTLQAIFTMNMRQNVEGLIVCLAISKYHWLKEARKGMIGTIKAYIYEPEKIRWYESRLTNHPKTTTLHIINYDLLNKYYERLKLTPYNFFVADECQKVKNKNSFRSKASQELARKAKWKLLITGTPIFNKPKDLFAFLNIIDPDVFSNFDVFAEKFCGGRKIKKDGEKKKTMQYDDGATNMSELNILLRANYMLRRMIKDVLKDLPDKVKDVIVLQDEDLAGIVAKENAALLNGKEAGEKLQTEIERLKELSKDNQGYQLQYKDKVKMMREIKMKNFGEISKIRKELALKKIPYVIDFVKETLDNSQDPLSKIVVFGHHTEVLTKIFDALRQYKPVIIIGATSDANRQQAIELFRQKNGHRVCVVSMGAGGTGTDGLQDNCNMAVFAELDWTPATVAQCESRLHRSGQKSTVFIYHIVADGSIDSRIAKLMVEKEEISKQILDFRPEDLYHELLTGTKISKN